MQPHIPYLKCMLPLKVYIFSEQGDQTSMKTDDPGDPTFQIASLMVYSTFCIQNHFKAVDWDGPTSQTSPVMT